MEPYGSQKVITPKQRDLLDRISRKAQSDGWCATEDLSKNKTIANMIALDTWLRQLELQGLIERKLDNRSREYVKLKKAPASERHYDLYELDMS